MGEIRIRRMKRSDMASLMRLKRAAGWNQVERDWETLLKVSPSGCFVAEESRQVVGSATTVPYGNRFGWIGMVIVDPDYRRRGIASAMMDQAIGYLDQVPCLCSKLDATDEGAIVYRQVGFREEYQVERWIRDPASPASFSRPRVNVRIERMRTLPSLTLDRLGFGASREALLQRYLEGSPEVSYAAYSGDQLLGFMLGREGSGSFQIGPLVAEDPETGRALLQTGLKEVADRSVIADTHRSTHTPSELLASLGFKRSRVLKRMYRGENRYPGRPEKVFLLSGFEFG